MISQTKFVELKVDSPYHNQYLQELNKIDGVYCQKYVN